MKNFNKTNMTMRRINLNLFRYAAMVVVLLILGIGNVWASSTTYYANLTISKTGETGKGKVYYATSNTKPGSETSGALKSAGSTTQNANQTYYWWVDVDPGYNVTVSGKITAGPATAATLSGSVACAQSSSSGSGTSYSATASIVAVTVNSVDAASKALAPTNPSIDYPFTVTFATSNLKTIALDLNKSPETADGKYTITSWAQDGNNVVATGKFNGGDSYGGASRNNSTTVSLQSKASGSTAKTCTVTANFPAMAFVGVSADDVYASQGESGKTGSATFKYNYAAEDDFPTTPTLTPTSGTGSFTVTGYTVTPDFAKGETTVTVNYSFDTNNGIGDTPATLTLTAANGDVRTATVTGHSEAMATNDASVTPAGGSATEYATFAQALAAANGLTGSTLTLLRNVDLGTIAATQTISKAMTIDLNGKELKATVTSAIPLLTINATTTIKDSKSGGVIYNTGAINGVVYGVTVAAGKTLTVSGGTIKAENTQQYFYGTASVGGTETNKTSVGARGIQQNATATVNIEGGTIQGFASRNAFGIREEGSKANNTTLNITGGTIYAEAASYAYGVYGLGKVNISDDAIITVQINTNTVNGNETYTNYRINTSKALDSYTLNGYGYGVHVTASPTNKAADCYFGTLNMTSGTVNAYNANVNMVGTSLQSQYMYGVYIGAGAAIKKTNTAPDGTLTQKATAIGQITGGTINVENDGQLAYGVIVCGSYNSFDNSESIFGISNTTVNVSAYSSAYGILANATVGTSSSNYGGCYAGKIMLTNNNVTTTTTTSSTSVALYATGTMTTIKTATSATYAGEYEASGYMYVKSGTYTANSATSYATAAIAGPWTTSNAQRGAFKTYFAVDGSLGGNVESMSGIYISGGKFVANATTSHARGVWNSGTTIIAGGTFEANATTTNAYGIYSNRGVVQANGATLLAVAGTGTAYGVFSEAMINDYVGWKYAADYTLTNCNITASTTTGNTAYGVYINGTTRTISSVNSSYASIGDVVLGGYAIVGNASVKGCTINATSAGTTAGGIYRVNTQVSADKLDICQGELIATGNTIIARTNGGTTAYGIRSGGPSTISNNTITVTTSSTGSNGIVVGDGNATISGNTVTASGTGTVYGIQTYSAVNSTTGYLFQSNATLEDNTVTATTTSSNTAYAVYVTTADGVNIASGTFAGDYVAAGSMVINSGKYTATAAGTTGYALVLDAAKTKNAASGSAKCTVNGGKFKGTASSTYADVNASAAVGDLVLAGGYYVNETNLTNYAADGYAVTALTSGEVYNEGYRRQISDNSGAVVCKVYQGSTLKKSCQSVEEALQYAQQNSSTTLVIVVVENCVLSAGDHILPSNATLFVPYKDGQTSIDTHPTRYYGYTTPSPYKKLTFATGAHLDAWGKIQAGGRQAATGQMDGKNGCPHEKYGWIYLHEGSSITLESGSYLYAWGYVTGLGEIDAKRGSTVYESFQIRDWRGGTATSGWTSSNKGTNGAFPVTQYYIQNIESPIKFRPGAVEKCDGTVNAASNYRTFNDVKFIGTTNSGSFFEMEDEDMSEDTWVRKWYDAVNDKQVYEVNSSAKMNSITLSLYGYSFSSSDFVLPVTNNMKIHLLTGSLQITQNTELLPGAEIEVDKEATAYINSGKSLYVFDIDDWMNLNGTANVHTYPLPYSPSWKVSTTCPRGKKVTTDASLNIHGKFQVNGNLYTTAGGANIFSSNEDAGTITYGTAAPSSAGTVYVNVTTTASSKTAKTANPAWLKNEDTDEPWSYTSGTTSGKSWMYYNDKWNCWSENNCFGYDAQNHPYAKPKAYVQLTSDVADANHLYHDAETGNRAFIVEDGCMWWEVEPTPYDGNKYKCVDPDYDGRYKYYQYVNNKWQEAVVTITWKNGSTTLATYSNALYGVSPKYLNANPTKSATSTEYYTWKGWNKGSADGEFFGKDAELPIANENTTYYACFETHKYQYTITFKNSAADGGMVIDAPLVDAGERPVCRVTPTKTATAAETFEFSNWSGYAPGAELPVVTGSAEYTAVYTGTPRPYTITFQNFDGTVLQQSDVNYGTTPTYDGATPYRAKDAFYSYSFKEWSPAITSVTGEATYTAQYTSTTRGFTIQFVDYDGTVLEVKDVPRGQTPEYTGPAISREATVDKTYTFKSWSPAFAEVTEDAIYTATYTETAREYDITWKDGDGNTLKTDQVAYGETPEYSGATPTKTSTNTHNYTFNNTWSPAIVAVEGEATYTAQFNETERKYRVTWDANGGTCATAYNDFSYNAAIGTLPIASKTGHDFNGWFTSTTGGTQITTATKVTADVTYHAQWTINQCLLTVLANNDTYGTVTGSGTYDYGTEVTITATPNTGYKFVQWNDGNTNASRTVMVTANETYTATFDYDIANYTVKHWQQNINDDDYTEVTGDRQELEGTINEQTAAVAKTNYTGFDVQPFEQETIALSGTVVNIYYNRKTYLITWDVKLNGEQEAYKEETLRYGAMPSYGSTPTKESDAQYTYSFSGWNPAPYAVNKDQTYSGSFNANKRSYTITFVNDNGDVLESNAFEYGDVPSYGGSTPVSSHTDVGYTYTFEGWKPELVPVGGTTTYTAVYSRSADAIVVNRPETVVNNTIASTTTVVDGGTLTVGTGNEDITLQSTTIIVESGGQLEVAEGGSVEADVFIIQATTEEQGTNPEALEEVQVSGELSETGTKNIGAIYYDLTRKHGTEKFLARVWYAVAVPWAVEVSMNTDEGGVYIKRGDEYVKQRLGTSYDLLCYDGDCRAQNGAGANCWVYLEDEIAGNTADAVMVPGKLYMIYLTEETSTIRFKKKVGVDYPIHTNSLTVSPYAETTSNEGKDANWNGIANPATYRAYMNVNVGEGGLVQKFVPGTQPRDPGSYLTLNLNDKQAVGQPFFVQVDPTAGTTVVANRTNPSTVSVRYAQEPQEARYAIGVAANGKLADRLYIQTAEEKEDKYVIGKDMSKMGVSTYVAQMWVNRYDSKLCQNTVAWTRNKADYPIGISAPQAGEYMIFAPAEIASGDNIYLTLDGRVIWNLTYSPYYASLEQGTTTRYGLRIVRDNTSGGTTGVDEVHSGDIQCEKVIMDDHVYILRGEELYTVTGQKAK